MRATPRRWLSTALLVALTAAIAGGIGSTAVTHATFHDTETVSAGVRAGSTAASAGGLETVNATASRDDLRGNANRKGKNAVLVSLDDSRTFGNATVTSASVEFPDGNTGANRTASGTCGDSPAAWFHVEAIKQQGNANRVDGAYRFRVRGTLSTGETFRTTTLSIPKSAKNATPTSSCKP